MNAERKDGGMNKESERGHGDGDGVRHVVRTDCSLYVPQWARDHESRRGRCLSIYLLIGLMAGQQEACLCGQI